MTNQIIEIFDSLSKSNKDHARIELSKITGNTTTTISHHWFHKKNIPKKHQAQTIEILKNILQDQLDGYQKLISQKK